MIYGLSIRGVPTVCHRKTAALFVEISKDVTWESCKSQSLMFTTDN